MPRGENLTTIEDLFSQLHVEFGAMAPKIIKTLIMVLGRTRITFPDFEYLYRAERNRRIKAEFRGANHEDLAIRYGLKVRQIRRILNRDEV